MDEYKGEQLNDYVFSISANFTLFSEQSDPDLT